MLTFEWTALRSGDHVWVHDDASSSLLDGVVVLVLLGNRDGGVAVRVAPAEVGSIVVRPRRHTVHRSPIDPDEPCWRCAMMSAGAK